MTTFSGTRRRSRRLHKALDSVDGPAYCRVMRGDVPIRFDTPLVIGRARTLSEGSDLRLFSSSITTWETMHAADVLRSQRVSARLDGRDESRQEAL